MLLDEALDILKARLETIDGLTVTTDPMVTVVVPMAVVRLGDLDYNETYVRGGIKAFFDVRVYVSQADSAEGLLEARDYLSGHGDKSVRAALDTPAVDGLESRVVVNTGRLEQSDNYISAVFECFAHVPGPDGV